MAHVLLSDIIDIIALQYDEDPDSYVHGIGRTLIISHAKRILQELGYAGMRSLRIAISEVYASGKVMLPDDYVEYVKVYYCVGNYLMPAFLNEHINTAQWEGLKDFEEEFICTATGRKIYTESGDYLTVNVRSDERVKDYGAVRHDCFLRGYKYDDKNNCFVFDYIPDGVTHVAIEYVADPLLSDPNPDNLSVHKFFQKAIEAGVYQRLIETRRNVPMNEKIRAKKEWNIKYKDAVKELNAKPWEYVQMIMGWKHMRESDLSGMGGQYRIEKKEEKYDYSLEYTDFICQVEQGENEKKVNHIVFSAKASKDDVKLYVEADEDVASDVKLQVSPMLLTRDSRMKDDFYVLKRGEKSGSFIVSPEFYGKDANASIFSVADVVNSDEDDVYIYKVDNDLFVPDVPEIPDIPVNLITVDSELTIWGAKWSARSQYPVASQVGVTLENDETEVSMDVKIQEGDNLATENYPFITVYGKTCDLNLVVSPDDEKYDYRLASYTIDFVSPDRLQENDWTLSWEIKGITLFLKIDFQYPVTSDVRFIRNGSVSLFTVKKGEKSASTSISQSESGKMLDVSVYSVDSVTTIYGGIEKAWDLTYVFPAHKQVEVPRIVAEFTTNARSFGNLRFIGGDCLISYGDGIVERVEENSYVGHHYTDDAVSHEVVVFGFDGLYGISANYTEITKLNIYGLLDISCIGNQLTTLDISKNVELMSLDCSNNQLTSLDISQNVALTVLNCSANQLTSLDISQNFALTELNCWNNLLTSLNVTHNTALKVLLCNENQLTDLDVSLNVALEILYCYSNQLTTLDVSQNVALTELNCWNNQLTTLDVSQNVALTKLICNSNPIVTDQSALTTLAETLPQREEADNAKLIIGNQTSAAWIQSICDAKNWTIG